MNSGNDHSMPLYKVEYKNHFQLSILSLSHMQTIMGNMSLFVFNVTVDSITPLNGPFKWHPSNPINDMHPLR